MTLRSRRKRLTIAPNTAAKETNLAVLVKSRGERSCSPLALTGFIFALSVVGWTTLAASSKAADAYDDAGYASADREPYRPAAAANANGSLKWVPYKKKSAPQTAVKQTEYLAAADRYQSQRDGAVRLAADQTPMPDAVPGEPGDLPGSAKSTAPRRSPNDNPFVPVAPENNRAPMNAGPSNFRVNELKFECPSPKNLKPITELTAKITLSAGDVPQDCPWGEDQFTPRCWDGTTYTWTASALCHKPLYFEDTQLERYGHGFGPWLQPVASGANFFARFPILPYEMGLEPPTECIYDLGYYRPGSCAPYIIEGAPLSLRGAAFEAGAVAGAAAVLP